MGIRVIAGGTRACFCFTQNLVSLCSWVEPLFEIKSGKLLVLSSSHLSLPSGLERVGSGCKPTIFSEVTGVDSDF